MAKNLGIISLLIGAILLVIEGVTEQTHNTFLWLGLCLVVVGYVAHIFLGRKLKA